MHAAKTTDDKEQMLFVNFNQDYSRFVVGTDSGFQVWSCDPLHRCSRKGSHAVSAFTPRPSAFRPVCTNTSASTVRAPHRIRGRRGDRRNAVPTQYIGPRWDWKKQHIPSQQDRDLGRPP